MCDIPLPFPQKTPPCVWLPPLVNPMKQSLQGLAKTGMVPCPPMQKGDLHMEQTFHAQI